MQFQPRSHASQGPQKFIYFFLFAETFRIHQRTIGINKKFVFTIGCVEAAYSIGFSVQCTLYSYNYMYQFFCPLEQLIGFPREDIVITVQQRQLIFTYIK